MPSVQKPLSHKNSTAIYLTIDGDDIGRKITACYLENDELKLSEISHSLSCAVQEISALLQARGFKLIFSAADGIVGALTGDEIDFLVLFHQIQELAPPGITFSGGIGSSLRDAYCALTYAKSTGKNNLVDWRSQ